MFKSEASESIEGHESHKTGGKRGAGDEGGEGGEGIIDLPPAASSLTLPTVSTVPTTTDQFIFTDDFKRLLVDLVQGDTLITLRFATKAWKRVVDAFIDERAASGAMIVHDGNDSNTARKERRKLVARVVFLLNITKVGVNACCWAVNLVVVDIPEGVESIGKGAFAGCSSLTTVSFPTTLKLICVQAFLYCSSLENVDLLHTNLQKVGNQAFLKCSELKSMTIPDSFQTIGRGVWGQYVFDNGSRLVPSNIKVNESMTYTTSEVVAYLRSKQERARRVEQRQERKG
ncbi:hypothetical protein TL16_g05794 [Triparma laevis f. inornata]|uniref:Uncharacterized protein n=2 Tax=Triparma laevis TaxID=1534972 RepID=A0A9W7FS50_9STRA|nr:hypothetical protein TL16_g05794 [Triparma laevis f. inornata]GMI17263.1 hypothetical protein TrLO_g13406 [Triparma laevis f. longispina]